MHAVLRNFWNFVRQVSGDDAYERYCAHQRAHHGGTRAMTRREYFKRRQDEKWSKVSRCC